MTEENKAIRRIIWHKWHDPFRAAVQEHKDRGWQDGYDYLDRPGQVGVYQGPMVIGPAGIVPLNELNSPSKNFNLWVGHSSFDLDPATVNRMTRVPGVEILRVWTRYRFWLGVARAFEENAVKAAVCKAAAPPTRGKRAAADAFDELLTWVKGQHTHWAVARLASGKLSAAGGEDLRLVKAEAEEKFADASRLVTSWD